MTYVIGQFNFHVCCLKFELLLFHQLKFLHNLNIFNWAANTKNDIKYKTLNEIHARHAKTDISSIS